MTVWYDTLRASKVLKQAGFSEEQADAVIMAITPIPADIATKTDLDTAAAAIRADLDSSLARLRTEMQSLEHKLLNRLYASQVAVIGTVFIGLKMFGVF